MKKTICFSLALCVLLICACVPKSQKIKVSDIDTHLRMEHSLSLLNEVEIQVKDESFIDSNLYDKVINNFYNGSRDYSQAPNYYDDHLFFVRFAKDYDGNYYYVCYNTRLKYGTKLEDAFVVVPYKMDATPNDFRISLENIENAYIKEALENYQRADYLTLNYEKFLTNEFVLELKLYEKPIFYKVYVEDSKPEVLIYTNDQTLYDSKEPEKIESFDLTKNDLTTYYDVQLAHVVHHGQLDLTLDLKPIENNFKYIMPKFISIIYTVIYEYQGREYTDTLNFTHKFGSNNSFKIVDALSQKPFDKVIDITYDVQSFSGKVYL